MDFVCLSWWISHVLGFSLKKKLVSLVGDNYKDFWLFHSDRNEIIYFGYSDYEWLEIFLLKQGCI